MRILIINQPFWPDVVSTAQHLADWTAHLAAAGHEVTVIASRSVYGKSGAILPRRETRNGVRILRVGSNLFRKGRILTRLIDFGLFHARALWKALTLPRQDVIVCLTTPPFIGVVGMITRSFRGSRYVQYEMDLYPDIAIALGTLKPGSLPARIFERLHRRMLRKADRVIVLGRCMRRVIEEKGIDPGKLALVTPWADPDEIRPIPHEENPFRARHGLRGKFVVMYAGNLGLGHDIDTLLAVMERLKDDPDVRFVFIGGGKRMEAIRRAVRERQLSHVILMEYVPRDEMPAMLAAADVHVITQAHGTSGLIVPSKLYGILAAGRPSLYVGPADTEVAQTLIEQQAGMIVQAGDVDGLAQALEKYRAESDPGTPQRIRDALKGHTREDCVSLLTAAVESLASGS